MSNGRTGAAGGPYTRRGMIAAGAVLFGGSASVAAARPAKGASIVGALAIHEEQFFAVAPRRIYDALLDARQFAAFSGRPATIDPKVGGAFSLFGGVIFGRNLELVDNMRVVQAWRDGAWEAGIYSTVRFALNAHYWGTRLVFDHTGFPNDRVEAEHLAPGWEAHYWAPLRKYLR